MTKFNVTVQQFETEGETGLKIIPVDAKSIRATPNWMIFSSDGPGNERNAVAAFPTERVVSIVQEEG